MRTVEFTPAEAEMFRTMYLAFITSQKAPDNMAELSTATGVLGRLKSISIEPPTDPEHSVVRVLKDGGGTLKFEEAEFVYFTESIYPPRARWTHQGLDMLQEIKEKLDAVEKE